MKDPPKSGDGESRDLGEKRMAILEEISKAIEDGKIRLVRDLVAQAADEGFSARDILNEGMLNGLKSVGRRYFRNQTMVSDVLVSARAINAALETLKPLLISPDEPPIGRCCIGSVRGDLHDVGKNIVRVMLESRNIEVIDLGVDVAPENFLRAVTEDGCDLVCCSALLTATMPEMERVIETLREAGVRERVVVMVGGVPVTEEYCRRIGADIYTADGFVAAEKAEEALREMRRRTESGELVRKEEKAMMDLKALAKECGFTVAEELNPQTLKFLPEVREMCAADRCRHYDKSWACPPACGTLEQWQEKASRFSKGILLQTVGEIEDSYDFEAMMEINARNAENFARFADQVLDAGLDCLPMSVGACTRCKECTYPDAPCRFPDRMFSSMEACGLMVNQVCTDNGVPYNYGPGRMAYTSCLLYNEN